MDKLNALFQMKKVSYWKEIALRNSHIYDHQSSRFECKIGEKRIEIIQNELLALILVARNYMAS